MGSVALATVGVLLMTEDLNKRTMSIQSILFLIAMSFTLTRVSRDRSTFKAESLARPTNAYFGQVIIFFIVALACSIQSLTSCVSVVEQKPERLLDVLSICQGTLEYQALVWISAVV